MDAKLTLSVDPEVVERAKRWAASRGTSLSKAVEQYLDLATREPPGAEEEETPALRQLRGCLRGARQGRSLHLRHLERKYR